MPIQPYEPADDTDKDEYVMAGDNVIDAELVARNTSSETQESEVEGAAQTHLQAEVRSNLRNLIYKCNGKLLNQMLSTSLFH